MDTLEMKGLNHDSTFVCLPIKDNPKGKGGGYTAPSIASQMYATVFEAIGTIIVCIFLFHFFPFSRKDG